jgi:hypothetical protein
VVDEVLVPQTILEVIKGWKQSWFWRKLEFIGDFDWLRESIAEGSVLGVADGSFIRELFPDANSCAFVLECQNKRGRILLQIIRSTVTNNSHFFSYLLCSTMREGSGLRIL